MFKIGVGSLWVNQLFVMNIVNIVSLLLRATSIALGVGIPHLRLSLRFLCAKSFVSFSSLLLMGKARGCRKHLQSSESNCNWWTWLYRYLIDWLNWLSCFHAVHCHSQSSCFMWFLCVAPSGGNFGLTDSCWRVVQSYMWSNKTITISPCCIIWKTNCIFVWKWKPGVCQSLGRCKCFLFSARRPLIWLPLRALKQHDYIYSQLLWDSTGRGINFCVRTRAGVGVGATPFCSQRGHTSTLLPTHVNSAGAGLLAVRSSLNGEHLPHQTAAASREGTITTSPPHSCLQTFTDVFSWRFDSSAVFSLRLCFSDKRRHEHTWLKKGIRSWRFQPCPASKTAEILIPDSKLVNSHFIFPMGCIDPPPWLQPLKGTDVPVAFLEQPGSL